MSTLARVTLQDGRFVVEEVEESLDDVPLLDVAIEGLENEKKEMQIRDDSRRLAFYQWALKNPVEVDKILDELHKYGVLFEHEYLKDSSNG